jgi:Uma2 family endonuclease
MLATIEPLITVADLEALPEDDKRYELIGGLLIVSRAPSVPHQIVVQNIQEPFLPYLRRYPVGLLLPGVGVIFSEYDAVIPDLIFISQDRVAEVVIGNRVEGAPDLVIEVVSPGKENSKRDRLMKRQLYASYQVQEYWVVDAWRRSLEVYLWRSGSLELVATLHHGDVLTSALLPEFALPVSDIFRF